MKRLFIRVSSIYGQMMAIIILLGETGVLFGDVNLFIFTVFFIPLLITIEAIVYYTKTKEKNH